MSVFFKPYEGRRRYVFISYSHSNSDTVLKTITKLNNKELRLWYDEGIPAGSDWSQNIRQHMKQCAAVLFFLSETALDSPNCYLEIEAAINQEKPILVIRLDNSKPDEKWKKLLAAAEEISMLDAERTSAQILDWPVLSKKYYKHWTDIFRSEWLGFGLAMAFLAASVIGLVSLMKHEPEALPEDAPQIAATPAVSPTPTDKPTPTPSPIPTPTIDPGIFPVTFPDTQQEAAVRAILGKDSGVILRTEFADIDELYFCGNMSLSSTEGVAFSRKGSLTVNGASVIPGKVSDLSVISTMVYLKKLALMDQPLTNLKPLGELSLLEELYLSGSSLPDISVLAGLPGLKTLHLEHSDVSDLSVLEDSRSLREVTVSADMLPLIWTEDKPFSIVLVQ